MASENKTNEPKEDGTDLATEEEVKIEKPRLYRVVLINDDYTPMEFVILVLTNIFRKTQEVAERLMMEIHTKGSGVCGVYPYDTARTKVYQVKTIAKKQGHPLECLMEVVDS